MAFRLHAFSFALIHFRFIESNCTMNTAGVCGNFSFAFMKSIKIRGWNILVGMYFNVEIWISIEKIRPKKICYSLNYQTARNEWTSCSTSVTRYRNGCVRHFATSMMCLALLRSSAFWFTADEINSSVSRANCKLYQFSYQIAKIECSHLEESVRVKPFARNS